MCECVRARMCVRVRACAYVRARACCSHVLVVASAFAMTISIKKSTLFSSNMKRSLAVCVH